MKTLTFAVCGILLSAAVVKAGDDRIFTQINRLADGHVEISITNRYRFPITGYVVIASRTPLANGIVPHASIRYMDSVFSPLHAPPIAANDSHTIIFGGPHPGPGKERIDPELKAAIFADGSTFGEPDWIDRLIRGRKSLYQNLNDVIETLRAARGTGVPSSQLRQTIQGMEQARLDASQDREEKRGIGQVFENALANLEPVTDNAAQLSTDAKIDFVINRLLEVRQRVLAAKPDVVGDAK